MSVSKQSKELVMPDPVIDIGIGTSIDYAIVGGRVQASLIDENNPVTVTVKLGPVDQNWSNDNPGKTLQQVSTTISAGASVYVGVGGGVSLSSDGKLTVEAGFGLQVKAGPGTLGEATFVYAEVDGVAVATNVVYVVDAALMTSGDFIYTTAGKAILEKLKDGEDDLRWQVENNELRCFAAHTPIAVSEELSIPIAALRSGDSVLSFDPLANSGRGALVPSRVVRLFENITEEWLIIRPAP
jgi:hypothetical protein